MEKNTSISVDMMNIKYTDPHDDLNQALVTWKCLLDNCDHTFFQSTSWVKCWLKSLKGKQKITMVTGYYNEVAMFSFFVCVFNQHRNYVIKSKTANVNSTGNVYYDILYQEYNRIITARNVELSLDDIHGLVCKYNCDELKIERVSNEYKLPNICSTVSYRLKPVKEYKTYYVDLQMIRSSALDYIKLLSSNRRQQIRSSIRRYNKNQEIHISQAETLPMALEMLNDLMALHQKEWLSRGEPGAFSNNYFELFHVELMKEAFDKGQVQILKIYTEDEIIGYLYNFIYNNEVLFYQCGFNYSSDNKKRPGLVSHYLAIQSSLDNGFKKKESVYRFSLYEDDKNSEKMQVNYDKETGKWVNTYCCWVLIYVKP